MKRAINIVLILWFSASFAQEKETVFSVYFHEKAISELKPASNVSETYFKTYQLKSSEKNQVRNAAGELLVVDQSGVYLEKNKLLFITREQVREDSRYEVRNGYLFGVVENDSVLTALDGENYYFLIPSKTYLYEVGKSNSTIYSGLNNGEYLVLTKEPNNYYSCIYFRFKAGALDLLELQFDKEGCTVEVVAEKKIIKGDFNTYILIPTLKEWQTLFGCFSSYDEYVVSK